MYASGKHAIAICDRCGFQYPYPEMKFESTGAFVCPDCHDGAFDLINHPQNYPPRLTEGIALRNPRVDVDVSTSSSWTPDDSTPNLRGGQS